MVNEEIAERIIGRKYSHFLWLFIFLLLILWFEYLKGTIIPKHIMYCFLDYYIPFVKEFVIAYFFWFVYMAIGLLYLGFKSKKDFYKLVLFLALSMSISYIIFIIYPNAQFPRPIITSRDIFSRLVAFLYSIDGTNNVFPSIHVANAIGVHASLINCDKLKDARKTKAVSFIAMASICASTVLIKQHSVIDVGGGVILALIIYMLIYKIPK
ncbi:MAG: hypothetical protein K0R54_1790 [Clostridiaceae bacterium]|jgi:membrane-associated phospholipid phosphatase|nr:hypothetical protein [Clostridiaceae bacterium]